jgi:hypothetical protein
MNTQILAKTTARNILTAFNEADRKVVFDAIWELGINDALRFTEEEFTTLEEMLCSILIRLGLKGNTGIAVTGKFKALCMGHFSGRSVINLYSFEADRQLIK